jgi:hypothetical protein
MHLAACCVILLHSRRKFAEAATDASARDIPLAKSHGPNSTDRSPEHQCSRNGSTATTLLAASRVTEDGHMAPCAQPGAGNRYFATQPKPVEASARWGCAATPDEIGWTKAAKEDTHVYG